MTDDTKRAENHENNAVTEPQAAIRNEINQVMADKTMSEKEKQETLKELAEALKAAAPIKFPGNIELVKKYYDKIDASLT